MRGVRTKLKMDEIDIEKIITRINLLLGDEANELKTLIPVRTGRLMGSFFYEDFVFGIRAPYASIVNKRTGYWDKIVSNARKAFKRIVKDVVNELK